MNKEYKNHAFTLIELLAVIVILAITLVIAVPLVLNTIEVAKKGAMESDAKLIIDAINKKMASDETFIYTSIKETNIEDKLGIKNINYKKIEVTEVNGEPSIYIEGKNKWDGYSATGTYDEIIVEETISLPQLADKSGANAPVLLSNMIPVRWNGTNWVKADKDNYVGENSWYDYNNKMWANAVTVTSNTRSSYQSAAPGTIILMNDILTFFVWIPRYKYAVPTGSGPRTITIIFEPKNQTKSVGDGAGTNYLTHPAFTFVTTEVSGIWFGKFETGYMGATSTATAEQTVSTSDKIIIKPNTYSWRLNYVSNFFNVSRNMQQTNNIYGFALSGLDTHMVKNTEWGAVAYLSHSNYGVNNEVWINPSSSYITGCAGDSASSTAISGCLRTYETTNGVNASTTGNIYGIYDMSGGAAENTMANYNNTLGDSNFSSMPNSKYYDLYTGTVGLKGDATNADSTNGWYNDYQTLVNSSGVWDNRGGKNSDTTGAGIFSYPIGVPSISPSLSFRVCIVPEV